MPGAAVCVVGSLSEIRTRRAATPYGWALRWSVHGCIAPRRHSPNRRRSAVPGPRPVAPHAVPGGPGHLPRIAFHISLRGWRILARWPPPRSTSVLRARRARGGCPAWATIASWRACARATTPRSRSSTTATTAACSPSAGTCSAAARRPRTPCSTASPRPTARCAAARATSSCARGCTRSRATAACRPCGRSARRSPPTGWRPSAGSFEGMSAQVQLRADLRELVEELQRLPDDQRAALVLFELGDQSHAQIAAVLGVRREKVKALVFQAREALMRARDARATPCVEIREQLATVAGRVPRRSMARRPHRPLPRLRGVRARGPPPARRARGDPAPGADRRPEGLGPGLRARRRRRRRAGRRGRRRRGDGRRGRRARGRRDGRWSESRAAPARPLRAPSAPPARRAWPRAWPPGGGGVGLREPAGQGRRGEDPVRRGPGRRRRAGASPQRPAAASAGDPPAVRPRPPRRRRHLSAGARAAPAGGAPPPVRRRPSAAPAAAAPRSRARRPRRLRRRPAHLPAPAAPAGAVVLGAAVELGAGGDGRRLRRATRPRRRRRPPPRRLPARPRPPRPRRRRPPRASPPAAVTTVRHRP